MHGCTVLSHLPTGAELAVAGGRLRRGSGYARADAAARRELARVGAIVRLRERGAYFLHAAGVVDPDGRAWILTGASGCGKSTLAFALARRGWRVLGDDGVVVRWQGDAPVAHGWREPLRMSASLLPRCPELAPRASLADPEDERRRFPVDAPFARSAPVAACIFPERSAVDRATPAAQTESLARLIAQSPWVLLDDAHAAPHFRALHRLAGAVPAFRLEHTERALLHAADTLAGALA